MATRQRKPNVDEDAGGMVVYRHPEIPEILRVEVRQFDALVEVDFRQDVGTEVSEIGPEYVLMTRAMSPDDEDRIHEALRFCILHADWSDRVAELEAFYRLEEIYTTGVMRVPLTDTPENGQ